MLFVDGIGFSTKAEYEDALWDKAVIDEIKSKYDLDNPAEVEKLFNEMRNFHFRTKLGENFDDYIYELYQKIKSGNFVPEKSISGNSGKGQKRVKQTAKKPASQGKTQKSKRTTAYDDNLDSVTKKKVLKEIKKRNRIRNAVIVVLLVIATFSIGYFVKYYHDARMMDDSSENLNELKDLKFAPVLSVEPVLRRTYEDDVVIPEILDEYKALYNRNKSLVGWVKIEDTVIDYPVTQTEDNEYYLKYNFDLKKDANGCIFLDANCDIILGNTNFILYGHHMNNGRMFSSLIKYANKDFYEKHKIIEFDTIYEKGKYEVMYAFRSRVYSADVITFKYYQFIDANSPEEFDSNMEEMAKISLIDTGVTAVYGDRLLTLSTCDYQEENGRFVVVAKRIE
ncbi:MAG: class B sortase [Lachnospiraceae bacterium]|nr:class B sortase [Lachnospiraceae bacterium]